VRVRASGAGSDLVSILMERPRVATELGNTLASPIVDVHRQEQLVVSLAALKQKQFLAVGDDEA
jgi:hypothetical protein